MDYQEFEQLVTEAIEALPAVFRERLENVEIVVEDWPDPQTMRQAGIQHPSQLLGFYHGVPLTGRSQGYNLVLPDKISLYRQPIMMSCQNWEELSRLVHRVLKHEIAHHFGLDDDRLRQIGAY
ncbi:MAG: metallopeptidase family protein [Thermoflexales bacterium]|nr:metallopeptidase family protein [Thermoflexales bacterium]